MPPARGKFSNVKKIAKKKKERKYVHIKGKKITKRLYLNKATKKNREKLKKVPQVVLLIVKILYVQDFFLYS